MEVAMLIAKEATIREKMMQVQSSITPYFEVLHKEQAYVEIVLKKDPNVSTLDGLVHLAAEIVIQHKSLEIALDNWDATLKMIMEVNSAFLVKYGLNPQNPLTFVSKRGRYNKGDITKGEIHCILQVQSTKIGHN